MSALDAVSLFAGVGGVDLAAEQSGIETRLACEANADCRTVLAARFPTATIHPDVRTLTADDIRRSGVVPDRTVLTAGWPCQGNSVAGRRGGMGDPRSGLWSHVARLLGEFRPRWFVGENVPGLLSVNGGRDFGVVVQDLAELGYGFAWRVLDARYFGVPQRRRRVILVGHLGDSGAASAEVLFESEGVRGDSPPRRKAGTRATATARAGYAVGVLGRHAHALTAEGADASEDGTGRGTPVIAFAWQAGGNNSASGAFQVDGTTPTLPKSQTLAVHYAPKAAATITAGVSGEGVSAPGRRQEDDTNLVAYVAEEASALMGGGQRGYRIGAEEAAGGQLVAVHENQRGEITTSETAGALKTGGGKPGQGYPAVTDGVIVRRLTPLECERLQGFPDGWTDVPGTSDSQRYRQMGNAVAVPVLAWTLGRLAAADAALEGSGPAAVVNVKGHTA